MLSGGRGAFKVSLVYIHYSYLSKLLRTNIFDIRWFGTQEKIYSVFVFGQVTRNEYIRYSYSVNLLVMNIFDICIRCKFHLRTYSYSVKNLIFLLHWNIFMNPTKQNTNSTSTAVGFGRKMNFETTLPTKTQQQQYLSSFSYDFV